MRPPNEKALGSFLGIVLAAFFATSETRANSKTVSEIIDLYQEEARRKFGAEIQLVVKTTNKPPNAYTKLRFTGDGGVIPEIHFYSSAFELMNDDELLTVTCHELGHLLGDATLIPMSMRAVEGEADYFSGPCMVRYLTEVRGLRQDEVQETAFEIAHRHMEKFAQQSISAETALDDYYWRYLPDSPEEKADRLKDHEWRHILEGYPAWDCRLLTVWNGIHGRGRPPCWYNPKREGTPAL